MEVTLYLESSHAPCPACAATMTRLQTRSGFVAGCVRCGGVWIDHIFGRMVLEARLAEATKAFFRYVAEGATGVRPTDYRTAGRREERTCPECNRALVAHKFGRRGLMLDLCGEHGTFFDIREIDDVILDAEMQRAVATVDAERRAEVMAQKRLDVVFALFDTEQDRFW